MKKSTAAMTAAIVLAIIILTAAVAVPFSKRGAGGSSEETVQSITETVEKLALQCYVIEGAYPQSLEYLEENYGLTVNKKDYLIVYTPFAENLPPDIRVIDRRTAT